MAAVHYDSHTAVRLGLDDAEVGRMSKAEAIARIQAYWTEPPEDGA
jgi:hypothetical protein